MASSMMDMMTIFMKIQVQQSNNLMNYSPVKSSEKPKLLIFMNI